MAHVRVTDDKGTTLSIRPYDIGVMVLTKMDHDGHALAVRSMGDSSPIVAVLQYEKLGNAVRDRDFLEKTLKDALDYEDRRLKAHLSESNASNNGESDA